MKREMTHRQAMKFENQRRLLSLLYQQPTSRISLARKTGLTQASVSIIADDLIRDGIVAETNQTVDEAGKGRKPTLLDINRNWGYIIGISIDRDGIDIGLVNLRGEIIDRFGRFSPLPDYSASLDAVARKVKALLARHREKRIIGAGVAVPGPFDEQCGRMLNPPGFYKEWHSLNLRQELQNRLDLPFIIEHNSIAMAKAEKCFGEKNKYANFILINVNAGLGAGLVLNHAVYSGPNGYGGEFGHTSIDINGRLCSCGNRGCIEQYASLSALLYSVQRVRPDIAAWEQLVDLAYEGDELCNRFLEEEAQYLAHAIVNQSNLLGLEAAIIAGRITYRPHRLISLIREKINSSHLTQLYRPLYVGAASVKDNPYISSGAAIVIDRFFNGELYVSLCHGR